MTHYTTADAQLRALAAVPARASYQRALLAGDQEWSGADLRGAAKHWTSRYAASRRSLLDRLDAAGLVALRALVVHGRIVMIIGEDEAATLARRAEIEEAARSSPRPRRPRVTISQVAA